MSSIQSRKFLRGNSNQEHINKLLISYLSRSYLELRRKVRKMCDGANMDVSDEMLGFKTGSIEEYISNLNNLTKLMETAKIEQKSIDKQKAEREWNEFKKEMRLAAEEYESRIERQSRKHYETDPDCSARTSYKFPDVEAGRKFYSEEREREKSLRGRYSKALLQLDEIEAEIVGHKKFNGL